MVTIEDFSKIELRIGKIVEVEDLEGAKKPIYAMKVDLGELGIRSIAAGIKDVYSKEQLLGKRVVVVANLDPKRIANFVSEGMVLAAEDESGISLLGPDKELMPGSRVR
ncbi:MAG: tRNA-binding protein [Candidatus Micrarchaeales archaeon]|jgi:export-related chaperone CsaA|uniref:Methionine--tRNA ligase n=1 Tax=Candidatus Micrarchaeum acidiphilum ARMAN-2 TaxID=425595 RepID=C7DHX1_MICA2|nr:MAG: t-RNA-binding domain protein [Candidatus Micrarchaeum acidiphilum ARMAN-2]MCW6160792.1 tRNA-binding protein [Candidatus Micrarchaeales archaeon]